MTAKRLLRQVLLRCLAWAIVIVGLPYFSISMSAQSCFPYSQFMALAQPTSMLVKLTYVGVQEEPVETVLFSSGGIIAALNACQHPGLFYDNDRLGTRIFSATPVEMTNLLELANQIPVLHGGPPVDGHYLSFSMVSRSSLRSEVAFEAVLKSADAGSVLNAARAAVANNPLGLRTINELGCDIALPEPGKPADVTSSFAIQFSMFVVDPVTGYYVGTVTLTNISSNSIAGPASLVLTVPPDVPLVNADGYSCQITPIGRPFVQLVGNGVVIPPGYTIQLMLKFVNPAQEQLNPTAQLLAGSGAR